MFAASKTASVSGGYQISRSLRFNSADSAYLNRTPASAGNRRTWTWSAWIKRSALGVTQQIFSSRPTASPYALIYFASETLNYAETGLTLTTTQVFRDVSAWYHIVIATDTTQATASDRLKFYVNGVQVTSFSTATYPSQNYDTQINTATQHNLSGAQPYGAELFTGYMTEVNFIDGQALTPSSFGETNAQTGVWQPKAYSGSYGTNGFYLNFSDNSNTTAATLGKDYSGNGNNWTPNNFSVTAGAGNDSLVDSPTSYGTDTGVGGTVRGNYATFNPLVKVDSQPTLSNGNLLSTAPAGWSSAVGTIGLTSGKWYWEIVNGNSDAFVGICGDNATLGTVAPQSSTATILYYGNTGNKRIDTVDTAYGSAFSTQTIGVALDIDGGTIVFYRDNVSQGSISLSSSTLNGKTIFPLSGVISTTATVNFGQRPFAYTAPSGFKALCTQNLPTPTIGATSTTQAALYFTPTTYTGNGSASRAITNGINMATNGGLVWSKQRSGVEWHFLIDNVRGNTKYLSSNATNAEGTISTLVTSFDSTGYSIGNDSGINANGSTYVSWVWGAGGSGSTNTAGSITSTVSASTTSGFSVVTYTGNATSTQTVGHGIGIAPSMVIVKARSAAEYWYVWAKALNDNNKYLFLNTNGTGGSSVNIWQNTAPTSTVFSLGNDAGTNGSGTTYVAYCFAEIAGYSKFGSYTGNGSSDGPFIYTGFRPAYVMVKVTTAANVWLILDATRNTSNVVTLNLNADQSSAENTYSGWCDFTSNGFKVRGTDGAINTGSGTYIYMAFASNPFKYSLAR